MSLQILRSLPATAIAIDRPPRCCSSRHELNLIASPTKHCLAYCLFLRFELGTSRHLPANRACRRARAPIWLGLGPLLEACFLSSQAPWRVYMWLAGRLWAQASCSKHARPLTKAAAPKTVSELAFLRNLQALEHNQGAALPGKEPTVYHVLPT